MANSSVYFKTALFLILVSVVLHAVGFSTRNWIVLSYEGVIGRRHGLWQSCTEILGLVACEESIFKGQGWFIAVQVLQAVGLACIVINLLLSTALFLSVTSSILVKVNMNICSLAGSLIGIGLAIFAIKTFTDFSGSDIQFGYSYWLSLAAMIDLFIVVVLLVFDKRKRGRATM